MNLSELFIGGDLKVTRIGLGTNRIQSDDKSRTALKKAVALGINFIDTASAYSGGVSETVIGETLAPYPGVVIATKGGMVAPDYHIDASIETLSSQLENSLNVLHLQTIPVYFLHRVDPHIPLKESLEYLKQMQKEGKIRHLGLSQVSIAQIEEARKYADIVAVQNEYNLSARMYEDVIDYTDKEGIVFLPFFPLHFDDSQLETLKKLSKKYKATPNQIAIAWLLKRSPLMLPIPGTLSVTHLKENVDAQQIQLSDADFTLLSNS